VQTVRAVVTERDIFPDGEKRLPILSIARDGLTDIATGGDIDFFPPHS